MAKGAVATASPLPMGFRINPELTLVENAKEAWGKRKNVHHAQIEHNARVAARRVFPREIVDADALTFAYDEALYPDIPKFEIDGELFAFNNERKEFALVEICGGCGQHWKFNGFLGIADLGREIASRDARDPFLCNLCKALERSK